MERRKTTYYLDPEVLRATKVAAAREDKPEYLVVEDALRRHLGIEVLERMQRRAGLSEEEASAISVEETRAVRKAHGAGRSKRRSG